LFLQKLESLPGLIKNTERHDIGDMKVEELKKLAEYYDFYIKNKNKNYMLIEISEYFDLTTLKAQEYLKKQIELYDIFISISLSDSTNQIQIQIHQLFKPFLDSFVVGDLKRKLLNNIARINHLQLENERLNIDLIEALKLVTTPREIEKNKIAGFIYIIKRDENSIKIGKSSYKTYNELQKKLSKRYKTSLAFKKLDESNFTCFEVKGNKQDLSYEEKKLHFKYREYCINGTENFNVKFETLAI
jgi:hypothetical protein